MPLITHLRQLVAAHQKKSYTVAVGKLNPAKLANFIEVECFVLVACPENSMVDSKVRTRVGFLSSPLRARFAPWLNLRTWVSPLQEFLRPIVTPFELELALTSKAWTGDYILDFAQLLGSSTFGQDAGTLAAAEREQRGEEDLEEDEDAPVFSSATGQYRHPKKYVQRGFKGESLFSPLSWHVPLLTRGDCRCRRARLASDRARDPRPIFRRRSRAWFRSRCVVLARLPSSMWPRTATYPLGNFCSLVPPCAGEYMAGRTYKGLEPRYGMDAPAQLEMGREGGIARGYGYERDAKSKQSGGGDNDVVE